MDGKRETSEKDYFEVIDDNDENISMKWSLEEVQEYILSKIATFIQDPTINPLISINKEYQSSLEEMGLLYKKYINLQKLLQNMHREQQLFLSRTGDKTTIKYEDAGVQVDLPSLSETISHSLSESSIGKPKLSNNKETGPVECIDLTSEDDLLESTNSKENEPVAISNSAVSPTENVSSSSFMPEIIHPAPLPSRPILGQDASNIPPKPILKLTEAKNGIIVQWDMPPEAKSMKLVSFEIFGYQERNDTPASSSLWERIGFVRSMPLPMSCTLKHFVPGCLYHFSIRAVSRNNNFGRFSDPVSIVFTAAKSK